MCNKGVVFAKTSLYWKFFGWHNVRRLSSGSYLHNPGSEPLTYATLGQVLEKSAHRWPGRVALRSVHEDITLSYEQLLTQADIFGGFLRSQGLQKGDRLGIWSHNSAAWVIALIAAARNGIISVVINPFYEKNEMTFCIKKTGLNGLLIGDKIPNKDYYGMLNELIPGLHSTTPGELKTERYPNLRSIVSNERSILPGTFCFNSIVSGDTGHKSEVSQYTDDVTPDEGCIMHFTSGTSGTPKVPLGSHMSVVNNGYFCGKRFNMHQEHHKVCVQVQLFHALGSIVTLVSTLRHGSTVVLPAPIYNVQANLQALMVEECTLITGTPTMYVDLLTQLKSRGESPPRLNRALTAGSTASPQLIQDMYQHMKTEAVMSLLGMTETNGGIFVSMPGESIEKASETAGYIMDHVEVKSVFSTDATTSDDGIDNIIPDFLPFNETIISSISLPSSTIKNDLKRLDISKGVGPDGIVDGNDKLVPFGTAGEMLTRSYSNMMYYWDDPVKTQEMVGTDGWLRTGDKVVLSESGYCQIIGRIKDIVIRGGENIAPREIEDLLDTHPDVLESQVIGVADDRLGEELCAVVRLVPGAKLTLDELRSFCTGRIAKFKIPRMLKIVDKYPTTATGKIQKYKLRHLVNSGDL